ncbi:hypothetical protein [Luethyella okanaganae]|uniref:Uncharacterized protein n=1 Tax=Luethyella okanaganae TaxID=69372 RepID=A0ABW1VIU7_9MICO
MPYEELNSLSKAASAEAAEAMEAASALVTRSGAAAEEYLDGATRRLEDGSTEK